MIGSTGCRRKLSESYDHLAHYHLESLASMVQCTEGKFHKKHYFHYLISSNLFSDRRVTLKKVRHFCNESSDGTPPLKLMEALINRYRNSWETG